jgi:hypothetical protein
MSSFPKNTLLLHQGPSVLDLQLQLKPADTINNMPIAITMGSIMLQALPGLCKCYVPEGFAQPEFCVSRHRYCTIHTYVCMYACLCF